MLLQCIICRPILEALALDPCCPHRKRDTRRLLTSLELKKIPIFSCLNDANLMWLSEQAADLHLEPGEYLIHEGEPTPFLL